MAKKTVYSCDRCGVEGDEGIRAITFTIGEQPRQVAEQTHTELEIMVSLDLCPDCMAAALKWAQPEEYEGAKLWYDTIRGGALGVGRHRRVAASPSVQHVPAK